MHKNFLASNWHFTHSPLTSSLKAVVLHRVSKPKIFQPQSKNLFVHELILGEFDNPSVANAGTSTPIIAHSMCHHTGLNDANDKKKNVRKKSTAQCIQSWQSEKKKWSSATPHQVNDTNTRGKRVEASRTPGASAD